MPTYTRRIEASLLTTGLTAGSALGYAVVGVGGVTLVARTTAGVAEDGTSANYYADVAGWDAAWSGTIVWDAGAGTLAREAFVAYAPQSGDGFARLGAPSGASIAADIQTRSVYAGADTTGTATLLARLTAQRATNLDNLDAAVTSRLAASAYTVAPAAATVATQVDATLTAAHGAGSWLTGSGSGGGSSGDGSVRVDHAYGATAGDPTPLAFQTSGGAGIDGAEVRAYLAADHAAGRTGEAFVVARVGTAAGGLWADPMFLDPGAYVLEFHKQGAYGRTTLSLTVS
jgi:hypothetical protein